MDRKVVVILYVLLAVSTTTRGLGGGIVTRTNTNEG